MSLKNVFAKVLMKAGVFPEALVREQLFAAIQSDDAAAVGAIFTKTPYVTAYHVPVKEGARPIRAFEAAVAQQSFKAATAMAAFMPDALTRDYSAGEVYVNRSILMQRMISGQSDEITFLIGKGADVRAQDDDGFTALHFAAACGRLDAVDPLLKAGAAVNATNKEGVTPLMEATQRNTSQMIEKLLECGAEMDTCDKAGLNATMHAIRNKNIAAATHLMHAGGVITDLNDPAVAALHVIATNGGRIEYLRLVNMQHDRERNRLDALSGLTEKQICETGTAKDIKVKPIRLKGQAAP
jgi:Ankyrin repeats (3 copies)